MTKTRGIILIIAAVAVVIPAGHGFAQEEEWEFDMAPYGWFAGIEGDVTAKGSQSSVDASFSDLLDVLDFGGFVHLEARRNKWGVFVDPSYLKLSADEHVDPVTVEIDADRTLALDALGGGRYWSLDTEIDISVPIAGVTYDAKGSVDWIDPFIGLRIRTNLTEKLLFRVRGDLGGFDIGIYTAA